MEKFIKLIGKTGLLPLDNIDTDMIIPKQYLKTVKRSGLGKHLFSDLRYDMDGQEIKDFVLNMDPEIQILLAGDNFGCGSSREHAPWALLDFGIKAIIAQGFADIFYNNCFKNGILPIRLPKEDIEALQGQKTPVISIDLEAQTLTRGNRLFNFEIAAYRKETLLQGLDDIEKVLKYRREIINYEKQYFKKFPWLS